MAPSMTDMMEAMSDAPARSYTVSDGQLVLTLTEAQEGGYTVTSPMDPELITEAETVAEAFEMARDALEGLQVCRREMLSKLRAMA